VNQLSCCKVPVAPDRATNQAQDAQHFVSIASMPLAAVIVAISPSQNSHQSWVLPTGPPRFVSTSLFPSNLNLL
jgi:hypothetical protein